MLTKGKSGAIAHNAFEHLDIIKKCEASGQKFTDNEFPPEERSLIRMKTLPAKQVSTWRSYVWKRAPEFLGGENKVVVFDKIEPNDIKQGGLGDCYFLSCLSVLAEREGLLRRLILTETSNKAGCYAVWLNDNGEWRHIIIDDYFPCRADGKSPAFSKAVGPELWVLLLEKAYAKMHGSYDVIEGGHPALALRDLTGAPYDFLESTNADEVWKYVKDAMNNNYLITCYTKSTEVVEEKDKLGIVYGHAYSILDAQEVRTSVGTERILQVRNPWGSFEWQGDWGDNSKKWTDDVKRQVTYVNADDGCFWMSVNDFVKYYEGVGICKLHEEYFYKSISIDHKGSQKNTTLIRLCLDEPTHIFISLNQKDARCFPDTDYDYSPARMLIGKIEAKGLTYIDGAVFCDRNVVIEQKLPAGTYIVAAEVKWRQNYYKTFNISSYSSKKINFEEVLRADFDLIERNLIKSYILEKGNVKKKNYADKGGAKIYKYTGNHLGILFYYYENDEDSKVLQETASCKEAKNVVIQPPYESIKNFSVKVMPQDDAIVIIKLIDENDGYGFKAEFASSIGNASYGDIQKNMEFAYKMTKYVDDPDDRAEISRDNSDFDNYIMADADGPDAGGPKAGGQRDNTKDKERLRAAQKKQSQKQKAANLVSNYQDLENQIQMKNLLDPEVWINAPTYMSDNSQMGKFGLSDFERNFSNTVEGKINNLAHPAPLDKIHMILGAAFLFLSMFICLIRPQFFDMCLVCGIIIIVISSFTNQQVLENKNTILRAYPYLFLLSFLFDLNWLWIYGGNWATQDATDLGLMSGMKGFVIVLSVVHLIVKFLFFIMFWRKTIQVLSNKN